MTIDTKNLRVLAEAGKATGFDLVDMNEHDFAACQKAKRELRTAMTPTAVVELLDALERKDRVLNSMRENFKLIGKDYMGPEAMSSCCDLCIEAITKELT